MPPHKSKVSCFNNVFLCTFYCTLRKSLEYPHAFSVHTLARIDLVWFRSRSSIGSTTFSLNIGRSLMNIKKSGPMWLLLWGTMDETVVTDGDWLSNKSNHPLSRNSHPSATSNNQYTCHKRLMEVTKPTETYSNNFDKVWSRAPEGLFVRLFLIRDAYKFW